jgi:hypothetical protein
VPLPRFGIVRNGEPLLATPLRNTVRTGIAYDDVRVSLGLVPEYEEREAAAFTSVPWMQWLDVDTRERAAMVAHFRMHNQVSLHIGDAVERAREEKQRRAKAKARQN